MIPAQKTDTKDRPNLFQPGKSGNIKGRPIGSGNKFFHLKQQLASDEYSKRILDIFGEMLNGSKRERLEALKIAVNLLPREDKLQHEIAQVILNKVMVQECPKCKARNEIELDSKPLDAEGKPVNESASNTGA